MQACSSSRGALPVPCPAPCLPSAASNAANSGSTSSVRRVGSACEKSAWDHSLKSTQKHHNWKRRRTLLLEGIVSCLGFPRGFAVLCVYAVHPCTWEEHTNQVGASTSSRSIASPRRQEGRGVCSRRYSGFNILDRGLKSTSASASSPSVPNALAS